LTLIILDFVRARPTQRDRSRRSVQRFFQCNHDVGLDVGSRSQSPDVRQIRRKPSGRGPPPKKASKKVVNPRSAKLKLNATAIAAHGNIAFRWLWAPLWRRLESARLFPICAKLIVFARFSVA